MNNYGVLPGYEGISDYYPQYTGGYTAPFSNTAPPPINSAPAAGMGSGMSTVAWGLALLGLAFILMHVIE